MSRPKGLRSIDAIMRDATPDAYDIIEEIADTATEIARDLSPNATGNNERSIEYEELFSNFSARKFIGFRIFTQSGYGGHLELGTRKMPARPYMLPGIMQATKEAGL